MLQFFKKPIFVLLLLWLFLTAVNILKPFQMDDGFHLEAAQHILQHPEKPMSGMIRWDFDEPTPMYVANQPPLFFYMIAGVSYLFGFSEVPLHLLISLFSFLALFWFYKCACLISSKKPLLLLSLFALCPALIVSQNVMTDVPILSLILGALYYLLLWDKTENNKFILTAIIVLSIAVFIKYTVLPVLAATALIIVVKKKYKPLLFLLIPLILFVLWSVWNYWEFGGSHLLSRKSGLRSTLGDRVWTFFTCIGSIATFSPLFLTYFLKEKTTVFFTVIASVLFIIITVFSYIGTGFQEDSLTRYLEICFLINGGIAFFVITFFVAKKISKSNKLHAFIKSSQFIVSTFLFALSAFFICFAPFMGIRHILLIVPMLLLLANPFIEKCGKPLVSIAIASSFLLSLLLGISEWKYAFYYKNTAIGIMKGMPAGSTVWATGTGAWQWYSRQYGMKQYTVETSNVKPGDYIVVVKGLPAYRISSNIKYGLLAKIWGDITPFNYFNVSNEGSIYSSKFEKPSWTLSKKPIDTVYVLQCMQE